MNTLVKAVAALFFLVSLVTWGRWLQTPGTGSSPESQLSSLSVQASEKAGKALESSVPQITSTDAGKVVQRGVRVSDEVSRTKVSEELSLGLRMGFTEAEALALVKDVELDALVAFLGEHSHITPEWLHRSGLPAGHLRRLYARWAAGSAGDEWASAPGDILLSRHSPRHDGGPYKGQSRFQAEDRTVYLHYTVPENYTAASVVIRWVHEGDSGMSHFDYHPVTTDPGQRQEAWVRPRSGWAPGRYRVEIFGVEEALPLLAARTYTVLQ